jgi:thymidylate kinase
MTKSKLILIEGIAGSGKSTVGQKLYRIMSRNNINVKFFHEFDPSNPIRELNSKNNSELINKSISNWRSFVDQLRNSDEVIIFDGILSQCLIAELILMCATERIILNHIRELIEIIEILNPSIIYLYQKNVEESLTKIYTQRNERWRKKIDRFISSTEFGKQKKLKGFSGYVAFNFFYVSILNKIMRDVTIRKILIENSEAKWFTYYGQIAKFLSIPFISDDNIMVNEYTGTYRGRNNKQECTIVVNSNKLEIHGYLPISKELLYKNVDTFFICGKVQELMFKRNKSGLVNKMITKINKEIWMKV